MTRLLCLLCSLLLPAAALADSVDISLEGRAALGKGVPALHIRILEPIAGFEVKLTRSDGKVLHQKGGGPPGVTRTLQLQQPEGKFGYQGELVVVHQNGDRASMPLDFQAELWGALQLTLTDEDLDLAGRTLRFRLSRPAAKAEVEVLMDTGQLAFDGVVNFDGEAPGTPLEVSWPQRPGKVMKIAVRAYDQGSFFTGVELYPWQLDVSSREDVHFDAGKWAVRKDQEAKLEASYQEISEQVAKFGRFAKIRLFIAAHTDTVGPEASNRTLSLNRARAIGGWFKKRGLKLPILYEGFGEQALRVATADETDEEANRRAEYIISVGDPKLEKTPFKPNWRKL